MVNLLHPPGFSFPARRSGRFGPERQARMLLVESQSGASDPSEVTRLLGRLAGGDRAAESPLLALLMGELRRLARQHMQGQPAGHTLQPTALLSEAWLRLAAAGGYESRAHFLGVASKAMRSVLVDHERRRRAQKRPSAGVRADLEPEWLPAPEWSLDCDLLDLESALERLEAVDASLARTVELLFHCGMTAEEAGRVLGVSSRTVERDWRTARALLQSLLDRGKAP
jgi:RNA polymerase sigma factor (TIGR02999 family)